MNKSRITLSAIVTLIGAIAFGIISFLGNMYLKSGNITKSLLFPSIFTLCLLVAIFLATKFKKARFNFQKNAFKELIALIVYFFLAVISFVSFTHFFTVQDRKNEIATKIQLDISNVQNMFSEYEKNVDERIKGFDGFLEAAILGKSTNQPTYLKYFKIGGPDELSQKNYNLSLYSDDIKPTEYDTLNNVAFDWLKESQKTISTIKPIGIMEVISDFQSNSLDWYNKLQNYDNTVNTFKDETSHIPFTYNLSFTSITDELTTLKKPTYLSLLSLLLVHILIFFIYLLAIRDGKSPGLVNAFFTKDSSNQGDL